MRIKLGRETMGTGLLILLLLAVGGLFLARRLGLHHQLLTLGNSSKARFARHVEADGTTVFNVTPARASWAVLLLFLAGLYVSRFMFPGEGREGTVLGAFGLIPVTMGLLLLPVGARHRKAVRLTVSPQALGSGDHLWPLADIAELQVRRGSRRGTEKVGTFVTITPVGLAYGGKPTAAQLMKDLGRRMSERSYLLTLRNRNGSREEVLCGGLTLECAQALLNDLTACLQRDTRAPAWAAERR